MEKKLQNPIVICVLALLCCALWGSAFPCIKIGYEWMEIEGTGSQILFAGYRFFLSGVLTFVLGCLLERRILRMKRENFGVIFRQGVLQTTIQYVCFYIGLAHTTGAKGSIINASNAFVSIVAAHYMIRSERMTWKKGLGCILGLAGVVLVNLEPGGFGGGFRFLGEGMVLLCTIAYGVSTVLLKIISDRESPMTITAYQTLIGSVLLIVTGWCLHGEVSVNTWKSSALLFYMALLSTVAFSLWTLLLKYNPVGKVAVYGFTIPIFGVLLSGILLGETIFSVKYVAALIFVSGGVILVNRNDAGKQNRDDVSSRNQ
ncbi:DMT family transporter [Mediterraneibacter glycyrrhizinilyticus]|uniref:DMT family transporter n=1 Tax=Mediterraneibacter glycyrrhizinilyticus TaxID=342942 RepID=UPI001D06DDDC|nr:DMT family transporter [Mediterraneibacter glycyrrhizinilyticus]MCB6310154.1 DMT family transporter [Lachnospiraceae bacterium 210521-DFI.1.109]MCB6427534.1 DMT family transporter [Mediterraneibacter glycyrrhizinilyticus]